MNIINKIKNLSLSDIKSIILLILFVLLVISIFSNESNSNYKNEIEKLKIENNRLLTKNDSIIIENGIINKKIDSLEFLMVENTIYIAEVTNKIDSLTKIKNEIYTTITNMSANDISSQLEKAIIRRNKNRVNNK